MIHVHQAETESPTLSTANSAVLMRPDVLNMEITMSGVLKFTKVQATALIGKTVKTSAGCKVKIKNILCDGPGKYLLIDENNNMIYRSHRNCVYVVE